MELCVVADLRAVPAQVLPGLALLETAHRYAEDLNRGLWDFAVEAATLRAAGLTPSDFRWLVCRSYVEHAREITRPGETTRRFQRHGGLTFGRRTCFVLTDAGLDMARRLALHGPPAAAVHAGGNGHPILPFQNGHPQAQDLVPQWDSDRHQLRLQGLIVKEYKVYSPNQETILMAFQEEGWPPRIDDPLPPTSDIDPKRRLHDTIKSLNRNQKHHLIRFMGDGSGEAIRWEAMFAS